MSNISAPTFTRESISLLKPSMTFFIISYVLAFAALVLNCIEIYLIVRIWKRATNFELVLLNLAFADTLNSILFVIVTGFFHYLFVNAHNVANRTKYVMWFMALHTFTVTASTSFVIVVGVERFLATKLPLKHRLWHTGRGKIFKCVLIMWILDIIITGTIVLMDYLANGTTRMITSRNVTYFMATILTSGLAFVSILYIWLAYLVMKRSLKLFEFDKEDFVLNPKLIKCAMKKDRATILVCALVVICLLTCNLPLTISLYMYKLTQPSVLLLKLNAVANPIIYFFKSYLERYYGRKKLTSTSNTKPQNQDKGTNETNADNIAENTTKNTDNRLVEDKPHQESQLETHQQQLGDSILKSKDRRT